jgi:hypothetical protein
MVRFLLSCFLLALVPAAAFGATAEVPLKLPSGWIANPALAQLSPIVWANSSSAGGETLTALAVPLNGLPPSVAMARIRDRLAPRNMPIWKTEATLCGNPGAIFSGQSSGSLPNTEFVVEQSGPTLYLFANSRASGVAADPLTDEFMRTACPTSTSALPSLKPPPGWQAKTLIENIGGWQTESGDSLILATTSLAEAARLTSSLNVPANSDAKRQTFVTCSGTGLQTDEQDHVGSQSFTMTMFVITTHESAYIIYYRHAREADPSVVAAVRAYCPSGASSVG